MNKYGFKPDGTKIEAGLGKEIVPEIEIPNLTMHPELYEHTHDGIAWGPTYNHSERAGRPPGTECALAFRRRKPKSKWFKIGECKRDLNRSIFVYRDMGSRFETQMWSGNEHNTDHVLRVNCVTHWQYAEIPAPPENELNQDEEAFEEWYHKAHSCMGEGHKEQRKAAWLAALEYARKEKK